MILNHVKPESTSKVVILACLLIRHTVLLTFCLGPRVWPGVCRKYIARPVGLDCSVAQSRHLKLFLSFTKKFLYIYFIHLRLHSFQFYSPRIKLTV